VNDAPITKQSWPFKRPHATTSKIKCQQPLWVARTTELWVNSMAKQQSLVHFCIHNHNYPGIYVTIYTGINLKLEGTTTINILRRKLLASNCYISATPGCSPLLASNPGLFTPLAVLMYVNHCSVSSSIHSTGGARGMFA